MQTKAIFRNFNPRSHERSDLTYHDAVNSFDISIHAPTRGATLKSDTYDFYTNFNPRSHERSDDVAHGFNKSLADFNPRSHERSDLLVLVQIIEEVEFQSTLPREERPPRLLQATIHSHFNPRSHERSDSLRIIRPQRTLFQSTLPREERPGSGSVGRLAKNFNPRSHERSDSHGAHIV